MKINSFILLFPFYIPAIFAYPDWKRYWIAFENVATGKVLDHYAGESIAAYDKDLTNHYHHWGIYNAGVSIPNNWTDFESRYVIKNRATGKVLDHYGGVKIAAYDAEVKNRHHHWLLFPLEEEVYCLQNLATKKVLDHYKGERIEAYGTDCYNPYCQWRLIEITE